MSFITYISFLSYVKIAIKEKSFLSSEATYTMLSDEITGCFNKIEFSPSTISDPPI